MIKRSVAIGCVVFGSIMLYIGYDKTQTVMGGLRKTFAGGYSGETIAYLVGGGGLLLTGLVMLMGKGKKGGR
jgi:hypothetical protein